MIAAALGWLWICGAAAGQEDLALRFLASGTAAYRAGLYPLAARDLRVARFMSIENPARHLEVLARLAIAEDAGREIPARDATLERFYDVERRFGAFAASALEPDLRERFRQIAEGRIGRARILEVPTLAAG